MMMIVLLREFLDNDTGAVEEYVVAVREEHESVCIRRVAHIDCVFDRG